MVPGAQVTLLRGARVRLEVDADCRAGSAVIEGTVRFSCPAAELDIREGQTVRVEPANTARFWLDREVAPMELDRWSEERDKALATSSSGSHVPAVRRGGSGCRRRVGADRSRRGVEAEGRRRLGAVPERPLALVRRARLHLGERRAWGWLPYHYGRWTRKDDLGWVWVPAASPVFKPGECTGCTTRSSPAGDRWRPAKTGCPRPRRSSFST